MVIWPSPVSSNNYISSNKCCFLLSFLWLSCPEVLMIILFPKPGFGV